jgi:hypothetical protein
MKFHSIFFLPIIRFLIVMVKRQKHKMIEATGFAEIQRKIHKS